jgi:hypothetical protein
MINININQCQINKTDGRTDGLCPRNISVCGSLCVLVQTRWWGEGVSLSRAGSVRPLAVNSGSSVPGEDDVGRLNTSKCLTLRRRSCHHDWTSGTPAEFLH